MNARHKPIIREVIFLTSLAEPLSTWRIDRPCFHSSCSYCKTESSKLKQGREREGERERERERKKKKRERERADPGSEEQDERRQTHAPGLGPRWRSGCPSTFVERRRRQRTKTRASPQKKKMMKMKKKWRRNEEKGEEEGRRGKRKGGQHCTGKQLRRTLYWQNASTDTILASDRTRKTVRQATSKVRPRKFIANEKFVPNYLLKNGG